MTSIVIDGPIAAGKTTLARELAALYGATLLEEDYRSVESLEAFYEDPEPRAFETELAFVRMHSDLFKGVGDTKASIADFSLERDLVYARVTLSTRAELLEAFVADWQSARANAPRANCVIMLDCPVDELLRRIRARGRPFEREITGDYLGALNSEFQTVYAEFPPERIIRVDSSAPLAEYAHVPEIAGLFGSAS